MLCLNSENVHREGGAGEGGKMSKTGRGDANEGVSGAQQGARKKGRKEWRHA